MKFVVQPLKISLRNLFILIIVITFIISSIEIVLKQSTYVHDESLSLNTDTTMMRFEASSIYEQNSTLYLGDFFGTKSSQNISPDRLYPLVENTPSGNSYNNDTKNIVVIGDSFVWGSSSLNRNELFWRQVENTLRQHGFNCRIYCVGLVAANAYDELNWLLNTSLVKDLNPDLVLFGYVYNDTSPDTVNDALKNIKYASTNGRIPFTPLLKRVVPNIYEHLNNYVTAKTMYNDEYADNSFIFVEGSNMPIFITKALYMKSTKMNLLYLLTITQRLLIFRLYA